MKKEKNLNQNNKINHLVFWPPFIVLVGSVILSLVNQNAFNTAVTGAFNWVLEWFDWLYLLVGFACVVVLLFALFSPWRNIKFGGKNAQSKYTIWQWFTMSLCSSIGIGVVFWGVAEPIQHLMAPAEGIEPYSGEAVMFSMQNTYLHWTLTIYAIYIIAAIPIGLAVYNYKQRMTIGSGIYFLVGEAKSTGKIAKLIDALCVFTLAGGIATSMGQGILQITSGLGYVSPIEPSNFTWLMVALAIVVAFMISSATGLDKGMNWLSSQNVKLFFLVMIFILIVGPTTYILKLGTQGTGEYLQNFFHMHFYLDVGEETKWADAWTVFYWAVWFAYTPIAGVFLTRISYGRTIKEFLLVNMIAPSVFGLIWFSIFGGTAIDMQMSGAYDIAGALTDKGLEAAVFEFFQQFPLGIPLIVLFLVIIIISFITTADSMTTSIAILTTSGFATEDAEPPLYQKVMWGIIMGALAWVMICFAGVDGTKMLATLATFPVLFVVILFIGSAVKGMNKALAEQEKEA